jgi:hypothetical protein
MIFGRNPRNLAAKLRDLVQPRKSWRRGFEYIGRRVQRLPDTPHKIALGFACGAVASFTPLFTLHLVVALALAWAVRGNYLASALGTVVGNPVTLPFIAAAAIGCGNLLLGSDYDPAKFSPTKVFTDFHAFMADVFWPYLVGGVPPGLAAGLACYLVVRPVVAAYQNRRRLRLALSAKRRVEDHMAAPAPAEPGA